LTASRACLQDRKIKKANTRNSCVRTFFQGSQFRLGEKN
jgi:hypothetical protein